EIVGVARPGTLELTAGRLAPERIRDMLLLSRERGSSSRRLLEQELRTIPVEPAAVWELGSTEAVKRAAREGLGVAFLSRYAVAEGVARGALECSRLAGRPPLERHFFIATLAGRALSPAERGFVATLTRCCAKQAEFAAACIAASG